MNQYELPTLQGSEYQIKKANEIRQTAINEWIPKVASDEGKRVSQLLIQSITKAYVWIEHPEAKDFFEMLSNFYRELKKTESK